MPSEAEPVVVLGGTGIVGSYLSRELAGRGHQVTVVDLRPPSGFHAHLLAQEPNVTIRIADIGDDGVLDSILSEAEPVAVFNLVAAMQAQINESILNGVQINVGLCSLVLDSTRKHDIRRVVSLSSRAVYGPPHLRPAGAIVARPSDVCMPVTTYGKMKLLVESMVEAFWRESGGRYCAIRTATQWGLREVEPGMRAYPLFTSILEAGLRDEPFHLSTGDEPGTDLISNIDLARAIAAAGTTDRPYSQPIYNAGSARSYKVAELVSALEKATGWTKHEIDDSQPFDASRLSATYAFQLDITDSILDWDWKPIREMLPDVEEFADLWRSYSEEAGNPYG